MVHLEKVPGQKGHMIIHEDGTIISSSGDLASNEMTSQQVTSLTAHSLPVNFNTNQESIIMSRSIMNGSMSGSITAPPGDSLANGAGSNLKSQSQIKSSKWNRITVSFGDQSYMACLSNRRIHVIKKGHDEPQPQPQPTSN